MSKQRRRRGGLPDVDLGVFPRLHVKVKHSLPYNAKAKTVERWHRTIKERFCTRFDTYTGGSPDEKPFDLEANKHAGKAPTLEELIEDFAAWLEVDYCNKEHGGADMNGTPAEVFRHHFDRPERLIEESLLKLETCRRELLKVGRNGVSWRGMTYESPELDRMTGEQVYFVIDDQDVNTGTVLFASGAKLGLKICEATLLRRLDVLASEEDVREAESEKRRDMRKIKEAGPARIRMADDPRERLHRKAALRTGHVLPSPASLVPHRSKFDRPALRLVDDEPAGVGTFGYYGQYADEPARAVNE